MKTDRKLLELAAKAAGVEGGWGERVMIGDDEVDLTDIWFLDNPDTCAIWDPLTDDGDALRLAAKLMLNVLACAACIVAEDENGVECIEYMYGPEDHTSGWRRAIVRAAAAIGEAMQ